MRDRWKRHQRAGRQAAPATASSSEDEGDDEEDEDAAADDESLAEWITAEILETRGAKAAERDAAVQRILAHGSSHGSLKTALGLPAGAPEAEVGSQLRHLLRLLHPDYSINQHLQEKQQGRVEKAFKRLNSMREVGT